MYMIQTDKLSEEDDKLIISNNYMITYHSLRNRLSNETDIIISDET